MAITTKKSTNKIKKLAFAGSAAKASEIIVENNFNNYTNVNSEIKNNVIDRNNTLIKFLLVIGIVFSEPRCLQEINSEIQDKLERCQNLINIIFDNRDDKNTYGTKAEMRLIRMMQRNLIKLIDATKTIEEMIEGGAVDY